MTPPNAVLRLFVILAVPIMAASFGSYPCSQAGAGQPKPAARLDPQAIFITIDNVTVQVSSPFLPSPTFTTSDSGVPQQGAMSEGWNPNSYLAIIAVPFGTSPPAESDRNNPLPTSQAGGADAYQAKLREYRIAQGGNPQPGPIASLFGRKVTSDISLLEVELHTASNKPTLYVEWVVEAGPRLWIVRIAKQLPDGTKDLTSQAAFLDSLESLSLSSNNLDNPSTLKPAYPLGTPPMPELRQATFTVDNVTVQVQSPFLPRTTFGVASPGDGNQSAASEGGDPFRFLQIVAVPFGTIPPSESDPDSPLPTAQAGGAGAFRAKMREYKIMQGGSPQPGPTASLFGQKVTSDVSLLQLTITTTDGSTRPFIYVEWVVEAGPRLWIVRIVEQLPDGTKDLSGQSAFLKSLESLTLSSNNLDSPSTLKPAYGWEPGMPKTGAVSGWDYGLPALSLALLGGSALLGGLFLRRKGAAGKTR